VLFRQAYDAAPTCSPSRAAMLSGRCPHSCGMLGLVNRGFKMPSYDRTLIRTLNQAGYLTVLAGLQHIAPQPEMIGYRKILKPTSISAIDVAPAAVDFLRSRPKEPFFIDCGVIETHRIYANQPSGYSRHLTRDNPNYVQPPASLPDTPETREDIAGFHASARTLDQGVGQVLQALEDFGLADNTLVISTTDHGIAFPNMKCNLTDLGMGVSLIMRGPNGFRGGRVCDALVSHLDLYPTLCEYLGIAAPAWLQGKSFLPVLRGERAEINEVVFSEVNFHASYDPQRAARTARWKYIRRFGEYPHPILPDCDDGLSKDTWVRHGWGKQGVAREELYDLVFDPIERNNLAANPEAAGALKEMRGHLDRWMQATDDPLCHGPIPAPHGAQLNPPGQTSFMEPVDTVS